MNTERAQVGWGVWLRWMWATAVVPSVVLAAGVALSGGSSGDAFTATFFLFFIYPLALASLVIGQWLVLRRKISRAGWWLLASPVGLVVTGLGVVGGMILIFSVRGPSGVEEAMGDVVGLGVFGAVTGTSLGIAQWLVLRRQVARAGWWVLVNTVYFTVYFAVGRAVGKAVADLDGSGALGIFVGVAVYGAITGGVLVWLLRQPVTEEPSLPQKAE